MMMSYFKIFAFFLGWISIQSVMAQENDLTKMGLYGKVKSMTKIEYMVKDSNGHVQKLYKGTWRVYFFNESGNLTETWRNDPHTGKLEEKEIYTYDANGRLTEINSYNEDNKFLDVCYFKYDEKGNRIEENIFEPNQVANARYTWQYDGNGRRTELNGYAMKQNGKHFMRTTFSYDTKGNKIEEKEFFIEDSSTVIRTYTYDTKTNLMMTSSYESGDYKDKTSYIYNAEGYLIQTNWGGTKGGVQEKSIYVLDSHHNWISDTSWHKKVPGSLTERTIAYY